MNYATHECTECGEPETVAAGLCQYCLDSKREHAKNRKNLSAKSRAYSETSADHFERTSTGSALTYYQQPANQPTELLTER